MKPIFTTIFTPLTALPLLVACTGGERAQSGECPAGEVCSDATPNGVHFVGNNMADQLFASGPAPTAIGGTQEVALEYDPGNGRVIRLDLPYAADDDGALGVEVDHTSGAIVTIRGVGSRANYLRIIDPVTNELYDRKSLVGAALDRITLVGTELESVPADRALVWAPGDQRIGIALSGMAQSGNSPQLRRIVDSSMVATLAGAQRTHWDELHWPTATVGVHAVSVTAGDKPAAILDLEIVDAATSMIAIGDPSPTVAAGSSTTVCFAALDGARYVYGLRWTFDVGGEIIVKGKNDLLRNCVLVEPTASSGTIAVTASAGGQSAGLTVTIGAATRRTEEAAPIGPRAETMGNTETTAGDRAGIAD